MESKYKKILKVAVAIICQEVKRGHLKWKVTDISRETEISRSHIYELLGENKEKMVHESLILVLQELYGLSQDHQLYSQEKGEFYGLLRSREVVKNSPELLSFYYQYRNTGCEIGNLIQVYEKKFLQLVSKKNNIQDQDLVLFIRTFIHGVSLAFFLDDKGVERCMRTLKKVLTP